MADPDRNVLDPTEAGQRMMSGSAVRRHYEGVNAERGGMWTLDVNTFEALYDQYAPAVARFAWSLSPRGDAAQEILQETFLTAWDKRRSIRLVNGSALPWLLNTCRNHARNHARRERKWHDLLELREESISADPVNGAAAEDLRWALAAVAGLPDRERTVIELCVLRGFNYREVGETLGLTEATVGKRLQRARARLREDVDG